MRGMRVGMTLGCCFFALAAVAMAPDRKAGLWDLTTTMTWQQAPVAQMPASAPHTVPVCFTQQMMDKYGAIMPTTPGCQITDVVVKSGSMSAKMACSSAAMTGSGTVESSWPDEEHASGSIHFVGTMTMGQAGTKPIEWTSHSTAVFKSSDCGSVPVYPMPK
jgi:hypothetical protein